VWLETVLLTEAATAFWLSALNLALLVRVLSGEARRARRVAALVLGGVCAGQAMEALAFLWLGGPSSAEDGWSAGALLLVRTALLLSTASTSVLLLRGSSRGR
jgi:hypothetical protein